MWASFAKVLTYAKLAAILTRGLIGLKLYPQSTAEAALAITPTDYAYPEGWAVRYGVATGTAADQTAKVQDAINVAGHASGPGRVQLPFGTVRHDSSLTLPGNVELRGWGRGVSTLAYYGAAEQIKSATPTARTYCWGVHDLRLLDSGTGTIALDLSSVSSSAFSNLEIYGFDLAVRVHSPTSGYAVYDRFYDVVANQCTTGFSLTGTSSNAHTFVACRFNGATAVGTKGFTVADGNGNQFLANHIDVCGIGFDLTASGAGYTDGNAIKFNRLEGCTTGINLGANVRHTKHGGNHFTSVTTAVADAGTYNQPDEAFDAVPGFVRKFNGASAAGGHVIFSRLPSGGANLPFFRILDENTGAGTPDTLSIESGRVTGRLIVGKQFPGGTVVFEVYADGKVTAAGKIAGTTLVLNTVAPTAAAGEIALGGTFATTVGAAGGAAALPGNPSGYWIINVAGNQRKVPYWPT